MKKSPIRFFHFSDRVSAVASPYGVDLRAASNEAAIVSMGPKIQASKPVGQVENAARNTARSRIPVVVAIDVGTRMILGFEVCRTDAPDPAMNLLRKVTHGSIQAKEPLPQE